MYDMGSTSPEAVTWLYALTFTFTPRITLFSDLHVALEQFFFQAKLEPEPLGPLGQLDA